MKVAKKKSGVPSTYKSNVLLDMWNWILLKHRIVDQRVWVVLELGLWLQLELGLRFVQAIWPILC